ncbi:ImmA/IrrE family metallo-endopeptidase [Rufibacter sp. LB8]|uniref:ImmA/IrrE family metallo-endopeptidase n=1 Tax=Rufibacter sp. LB8 TaxID=2777781 RepID=UPI00178C3FF5|nr:ImmA/IrrE family metallo-endopeptidase [Rufibacter sp. LB8]
MFNKPEREAEKILKELNFTSPPISIEIIAESKGIEIKPYDFGEGVSGALVIDGNKSVIGYNPFESPVRRRFTIAHELGHFVLHQNDSPLWIDKEKMQYRSQIQFRDQKSATGELKNEREANQFAAAILMPGFMIKNEIEKRNLEFIEEQDVKELADIFKVSQQAMTIRLSKLDIFWY